EAAGQPPATAEREPKASDPAAPAAAPPLPPWRRYAAHIDNLNGSPMIAVIIDDVGLSTARAKAVIGLRAPLTLAFLPYGTHLQALSDEARAAGHEVLVHMPMQPEGSHADPGPNALLVGLPDDEL